MTNINPTARRARVLRNLRIGEVSLVDRGAGRGVKVMLAKRDDAEIDKAPHTTEGTMQTTITVAKANNLFEAFVDIVQKRDGVSRATAYERAVRVEPELFQMAKRCSGTGGDLTKAHGASSNHPDPHRTTRNVVDADGVLDRLRIEHTGKAWAKYNSAIEANVKMGMNRSQAMDRARSALSPEEWKSVKAHNPMLPLSHDGNVPVARGPY